MVLELFIWSTSSLSLPPFRFGLYIKNYSILDFRLLRTILELEVSFRSCGCEKYVFLPTEGLPCSCSWVPLGRILSWCLLLKYVNVFGLDIPSFLRSCCVLALPSSLGSDSLNWLACCSDNWSVKATRRKTTGTGRMRYLRDIPRRFKTGFREGNLFNFTNMSVSSFKIVQRVAVVWVYMLTENYTPRLSYSSHTEEGSSGSSLCLRCWRAIKASNLMSQFLLGTSAWTSYIKDIIFPPLQPLMVSCGFGYHVTCSCC